MTTDHGQPQSTAGAKLMNQPTPGHGLQGPRRSATPPQGRQKHGTQNDPWQMPDAAHTTMATIMTDSIRLKIPAK